MKDVLLLLIDEVARAIGRVGGQVVIAVNPEPCQACEPHNPLDDEIINAGGGDGRPS